MINPLNNSSSASYFERCDNQSLLITINELKPFFYYSQCKMFQLYLDEMMLLKVKTKK